MVSGRFGNTRQLESVGMEAARGREIAKRRDCEVRSEDREKPGPHGAWVYLHS